MTSRERILAAIDHKETVRIPADLGSTPSSGISAIAYNNLKDFLAIESGYTKVYDVVQQVAEPEDIIIEKFQIDVLDIGRTFNKNQMEWVDVHLPDGSLAQYPKWFSPLKNEDGSFLAQKNGLLIGKMPKGATFFDQTIFPYIDGYPDNYKNLTSAMDKVIWSALAHSPWDKATQPDFWERLRKNTIDLRKNTDKALVIVCGCNLFEWGTFLRRMDNFLMDLYSEEDDVDALLDALMEQHMSTLQKVCESVGDIVDVIRFGDDLGMDTGPFMSPEIYRRFFKKRHAMLCDYVKRNSNMKTFLHSCGSIYKLIPDLIEAGFDIINPVQTNCIDMEPEKLKREFGKDITFWGGGCDTRSILNRGSPEQIKDHVRKNIEILAPGGGFVFNTVHNIMPDVPPVNIVAMFEAVNEYR